MKQFSSWGPKSIRYHHTKFVMTTQQMWFVHPWYTLFPTHSWVYKLWVFFWNEILAFCLLRICISSLTCLTFQRRRDNLGHSSIYHIHEKHTKWTNTGSTSEVHHIPQLSSMELEAVTNTTNSWSYKKRVTNSLLGAHKRVLYSQ
jgi:hypothetical protein